MAARDLIAWLTETARDVHRGAVQVIVGCLTPCCSPRESDLEARNLRLHNYALRLEERIRTLEAERPT